MYIWTKTYSKYLNNFYIKYPTISEFIKIILNTDIEIEKILLLLFIFYTNSEYKFKNIFDLSL